uniref:CCHC-type domain-containing protein n=1 Tax=Caenorhabditis tropicalis TaxID=1561998 RepID=A0A1I7UWX2_9PELO
MKQLKQENEQLRNQVRQQERGQVAAQYYPYPPQQYQQYGHQIPSAHPIQQYRHFNQPTERETQNIECRFCGKNHKARNCEASSRKRRREWS